MARLISSTGIDVSSVTIGSPQEGMKWVVKWAMVVLHTGSGTGSRGASMVVSRANVSNSGGPTLANTNLQSGTSTIYYAIGDVTSLTPSTSLSLFSQFPEIFATDVVVLSTELVSGDTVDYYIMVEEVPG